MNNPDTEVNDSDWRKALKMQVDEMREHLDSIDELLEMMKPSVPKSLQVQARTASSIIEEIASEPAARGIDLTKVRRKYGAEAKTD